MKVEDLDVFRHAHELTLRIYKVTESFPDGERFGLTTQMRRAASSICSNLAEGAYRVSTKEYRHFVSISRGSCGEIKYQLLLSRDLGYLDETTYQEICNSSERVSMMLTKLHRSLGDKPCP